MEIGGQLRGERSDHETLDGTGDDCQFYVHQLIMKWREFTRFSDTLFIMTLISFVSTVFTQGWLY